MYNPVTQRFILYKTRPKIQFPTPEKVTSNRYFSVTNGLVYPTEKNQLKTPRKSNQKGTATNFRHLASFSALGAIFSRFKLPEIGRSFLQGN
jgi:hypothetical protein